MRLTAEDVGRVVCALRVAGHVALADRVASATADAVVADLSPVSSGGDVVIDYVNWRGERRWRLVRPLGLTCDSTEWHPERQWLLRAVDLEKSEERLFALAGVRGWRLP